MTTENWSEVIFTDETCFRLHSNYIEVWHDTIEEEDAPYFEAPVHIPGVIIYGTICSTGKLQSVFLSLSHDFVAYFIIEGMLKMIEICNNSHQTIVWLAAEK